ncbi:transglycosylase SLT domain-containing protein, partial [Acinetobacter baumannii]
MVPLGYVFPPSPRHAQPDEAANCHAEYQRLLDRFGGSYPLAVAAYNAGGGNVNKWLRANGDPREGNIDWVDWVERIP